MYQLLVGGNRVCLFCTEELVEQSRERRYVMHRSTLTDQIEDTENNSRNKGTLFLKVPLVLDNLCGVEMVV
jgi:hypothetical protein